MELTPKYLERAVVTKLPERIYAKLIKKDLKSKMVFIGGPRQVGKTTLATSFIKKYHAGHPAYLNWDNELNRQTINKSEWDKNEPIMVFDEIHKKKGWQSLIKGIYDVWKGSQNFIVTGSARLDLYRKGGDSMLGRYHYYRMHPFSLPELGITKINLDKLFKFGGFPEPLAKEDETEIRRWHLQRLSKLVRQDLRDLEHVNDLDKVELLAETLSTRVGSALSIKSLAEELATSDKTVKRWIQILDSLYFCFQLSPFGSTKIKAIKKAQKLYLWDWSQIEDTSDRFENMVASHLLKLCDYWQDALGYRTELRYIRDETGKECDFVVLKDRKPVFAVECKYQSTDIDPNVIFFKSKINNIPKWYQVHMGDVERIISPDFKILPFAKFCKEESLI
jgi:uncharacterized protein